jgi:hypothetical protein
MFGVRKGAKAKAKEKKENLKKKAFEKYEIITDENGAQWINITDKDDLDFINNDEEYKFDFKFQNKCLPFEMLPISEKLIILKNTFREINKKFNLNPIHISIKNKGR